MLVIKEVSFIDADIDYYFASGGKFQSIRLQVQNNLLYPLPILANQVLVSIFLRVESKELRG